MTCRTECVGPMASDMDMYMESILGDGTHQRLKIQLHISIERGKKKGAGNAISKLAPGITESLHAVDDRDGKKKFGCCMYTRVS